MLGSRDFLPSFSSSAEEKRRERRMREIPQTDETLAPAAHLLFCLYSPTGGY